MLPRTLATLTIACALLVSGCADTVNGTGSAAAPPPFPRTVPQLSSLLSQGVRSIHTAHVVIDVNAGDTAVTATGNEEVSNGRAVSVDIVENIPSLGRIEFRDIHGSAVYVKDPRRAGSPKPWARVGPNTSDPLLHQLYESVHSTATLGSVGQATTLLGAAEHFQFVGPDTINGVAVGHYRFVVAPEKLPADFPSRDAIIGAGVTSIPVEIYVDHEGRARKGLDTVAIASTKIALGFELSNFDVPVHIVAPPPSQTTGS